MSIPNVCTDITNQKLAQYINGCLTITNGAETENELCCQKSIKYPVDSSEKLSKFIPARTTVNNVTYPSITLLFDNKLNEIPNLPRLQVRGFQMCVDFSNVSTDFSDEELNLYLRITSANNIVTTIPFYNQFTWFGNPVTEEKQFIVDKVEIVNDNDFCVNVQCMLLMTANTGAIGTGACPFVDPIQPVTPSKSLITLQTPALIATALTDTTIKLDWTLSFNASFFSIEYSLTGLENSFLPLATTALTTYTDTLTASTLRYYRVKAVGDNVDYADSLYSNIASATTLLAKLVAPTLTVTASDNTSINLSWTTVPDAYYYQIQTSTDNVTFTDLASTIIPQTIYIHTGLSDGTIHYYRVMAMADLAHNQNSDYSNIGSATTLIKLASPLNFVGTVISDTQIDLSWNTVVGNNGYLIERSLDDVTYNIIATTLIGDVSYSDTTLTTATLYYYRITTLGNGTTTINSNASSSVNYTTL